ncbi:hypothetical protein JQC92_14370 [Shewanella sp. 202IG2-18]|uniref:hypothetical protein n=1 Tax=Parashewanella hymeniacidonis TaxID=2807618 RepID=UPI001960A462|nr:hypothetical protein [Parashewanella hymeniacidonis]MBM7073198.1 hypothetical protein [Parashewanella hymeniacidonis]
MTPLEIAKHYFELSNKSDFEAISKLFDKRSTFCTAQNDFYLGCQDIMAMQRAHHCSYKRLHWSTVFMEEEKPNVISFGFAFEGETLNGDAVEYTGIETMIIYDNKLQHVQVLLD